MAGHEQLGDDFLTLSCKGCAAVPWVQMMRTSARAGAGMCVAIDRETCLQGRCVGVHSGLHRTGL